MRLTINQINTIKMAVQNIDAEAEVKLFGSRIDDEKHGGDIDLLINSQHMGWREVARLRGMLEKDMGEQKIDIVLQAKADPAFVQLIEPDAVSL